MSHLSGGGYDGSSRSSRIPGPQLASDYTVDQVSIGVTDDSHVAPIEMELRGCGVQVHRNLGWLIKDTSVGRLLQLTTHFIARGTWQF